MARGFLVFMPAEREFPAFLGVERKKNKPKNKFALTREKHPPPPPPPPKHKNTAQKHQKTPKKHQKNTHGTRSAMFFGGYGYVTTQDGTSRSESLGLRRLEIERSAHGHCSAPSHPCRALG